MLISFSVKNFLSFKDEASISLVPLPDKTLGKQNVHALDLKGLPGLLKVAAIYGPNAGGKTNLLKAMHAFLQVIMESTTGPIARKLPNEAFALDEKSRELPSEFQAVFIFGGQKYQYGFSITIDRVFSESLSVYLSSKPSLLFSRTCNEDGTQHYSYGLGLMGPKKIWEKSTRQNALYLSTAAQLNSELLGGLQRHFGSSWMFARGGTPTPEYTVDYIKSKQAAERVVALMRAADTGIGGISFRKQKGGQIEFEVTDREDFPVPKMQMIERDLPIFSHRSETVQADIEFENESDGTQKFFGLAGIFLEILEQGSIAFVDELDRSLHPHLVRKIVEMFNDPQSNPNGAQLVFTTHDTTLLDPELLRRDQIWFTEKDRNQASSLYSLADISVRKNEAFAKGYLSGRYGALPALEKFRPLEKH